MEKNINIKEGVMHFGHLIGNVVKGVVKTGLFVVECTADATSNAIKNGKVTNDKYSAEDFNSFSKKISDFNKKIKFSSID